MTLYDFAHDPDICGTQFQGSSWDSHRIIWRLLDGDGHLLSPDQQDIARQMLGSGALPAEPPRELFIGAGRRSGKTRCNSLYAVHAASQDYRDRLAPGEWAVVSWTCADRKQARNGLDYCVGMVEASAMLRAEVTAINADTIEFAHRTRIEVKTASYRTIRGLTLALAIIDEAAFLRDELSATPDVELYRAVMPALATLQGRLIVTSSLHRKTGLMWKKYQQHFGKVA